MGAIFGYKGFEDKNLVRKISNKLNHRDLDGFEYYKDKNISLGQGILGIGKDFCSKPVTNENEDIVLICDGRVFQVGKIKLYLENKGHKFKTDFSGEVILHLYEEEGMDFLNKINGDYAFCIYDSREKKLILCSDHAGSRPIYYHHNSKGVVFASDIKPILEYEEIEKKLDKYALNLFLTYLLLPTENTLFTSIKRVMPSSYVIFGDDSKKVVKYFEIKEDIDKSKSEVYFIKKTREELERAVEDRIFDNVPIHIGLGGLDSSIVTAMLATNVDKINTYSLAFDPKKNILSFSRQIAEMYNTNHREIFLNSKDIDRFYKDLLPYFNSPSVMDMGAIIASNIFFKIKGKRSLYFNGEGGDPVFGGIKNEQMLLEKKFFNYPYFLKELASLSIKGINKGIYILNYRIPKILPGFQNFNPLKDLSLSKKLSSLEEIYANLTATLYFKNYSLKDIENKKNLLFIYRQYLGDIRYCFLDRLMKINTEIKSYMDHMVRNEILATSSGMVNNCPFLDKQVIKFSFTVPIKYKFKEYSNKILLVKATKDLFPKNMKTTKTEFSPFFNQLYGSYFKHNKDIIKDMFDNSKIYKHFNRKFLYRQIALNDSKHFHRAIRRIHTLFSLGLWYEHYFNDEKISKYF